MVLGISALGVAVSSYANVDADIYWHRILGATWLSQGSFDLSQDPIAYTDGVRTWFPTSWVPEILYAVLVDAFGYSGILALRFLLSLLFFGLLARYVLHHLPAWLAAVCLVPALSASLVLQDRPQTFSLVFCAAALPTLHRWTFTGQTPGLLPAALATWAWANVHGLWVLVPALFVLAAVTDGVAGRVSWKKSALGALGCTVAAALTPVGPKLLLAPLLVSSSASRISEWEATAFRSPVAWGFGMTLLLCWTAISWGRRPDSRELATILALTVFGLLAYRNAVVSSILLLPVLATRLREHLSHVETDLQVPLWSWRVTAASVGLWLALLYAEQSPIPEESPARIAAALSQMNDVRALVPYNESGYLREFGGKGVRVSIDGRADRYGRDQIDSHVRLMNGQRDWQRALTDVDPDVIVAEQSRALDDLLVGHGWKVSVTDGDFVLLVPRA